MSIKHITEEERISIRNMYDSLYYRTPYQRNNIMIDWVQEELGLIVSSDDIYEICKRAREKSEFDVMIDDMNHDSYGDSYEVIENKYVFQTPKNIYKIDVKEIDEIFYDYSSKGGNMSSEAMLSKYKLKPEVWHIIKNRLRLFKDSNVISPYTAENTPEVELDEMVEDATIRHIDSIKEKMVVTHAKLFKKESMRALMTVANIDVLIAQIQDAITQWNPIDIDFSPIKSDDSNSPLVVVLSDIHFGKKGTSLIQNRLNHILQFILESQSDYIVALCLGDLVESLVDGGMHPGQEADMEMHGIDLILYVANIFTEFIVKIRGSGKRIRFIGIGGNHDRFGKNHNEDMQRTGALVIYELIKRSLLTTDIDVVTPREKVNSFVVGGTNYIIHHGDDGFSSRKMEDVLWKHGNNQMYNVILHGDKHHLTMDETKDATMIGMPALAGRGEYDKRLDLYSEPGFVVIESNKSGKVDILVKRLV